MIFITTLVLIFILRLRFLKGKSVAAIITRRYGRQLLTLFRECEKIDLKLTKIKLDIRFLTTCLDNRLTSKFVSFKLHNPGY